MTNEYHSNVPHHATRTEAPNGEGTAHPPRDGATQDRPILDGASEYYGDEAEEENPRLGQEDPALTRQPETGEHAPTSEESQNGR